ncbi:MAG: ATP-binding protein [Alphaproteobacteria bacterium]|nr:ATP-binding protein [Alphaproteobacteria bacterium]
MIEKKIKKQLEYLLDKSPAVVLTGPRQVGKTTLALSIAQPQKGIYLDLELPSNLAKVTDIEEYCRLNSDHLLIFDEIQHIPDLFAPLRGIIDERRRQGKKTGQFLFLGSASMDLLKQTSETLAGRIVYCELFPLTVDEVPSNDLYKLWYRGGFPESFIAENDEESLRWRLDFIKTYLERDIPQLGPRIPAETLRRFWTMLAHNQGQAFNAASFAKGLEVKGITTSRYLDLMVDLLLVRRLASWTSNSRKRLVKAPKTFVRDSGICHALLGIKTLDELLGHPVVGGSWEGFVIENIISSLPRYASYGYYKTAGGAEIDFVIDLGNQELWAIEIKRSLAPKISKGFYIACEDLKPTKKFIVYAGDERFPLAKDVEVISLRDIMHEINIASE